MNVLGGLACAGDGTGGESIYGLTFEDEIVARLSHDRMGVVSMVSLGGFVPLAACEGCCSHGFRNPRALPVGRMKFPCPWAYVRV